MQNKCPHCGAPVEQGARFCLHCMTSFEKKQEIKKEKPPLIFLGTGLSGSVFLALPPLCSQKKA